MALWLSEKGYRISGMDIATTAIAWAREQARQNAYCVVNFATKDNFSQVPVIFLTDSERLSELTGLNCVGIIFEKNT